MKALHVRVHPATATQRRHHRHHHCRAVSVEQPHPLVEAASLVGARATSCQQALEYCQLCDVQASCCCKHTFCLCKTSMVTCSARFALCSSPNKVSTLIPFAAKLSNSSPRRLHLLWASTIKSASSNSVFMSLFGVTSPVHSSESLYPVCACVFPCALSSSLGALVEALRALLLVELLFFALSGRGPNGACAGCGGSSCWGGGTYRHVFGITRLPTSFVRSMLEEAEGEPNATPTMPLTAAM